MVSPESSMYRVSYLLVSIEGWSGRVSVKGIAQLESMNKHVDTTGPNDGLDL